MITAIIADDEASILNIFEDLLALIQVKVVGKGTNGKEAVELYEKYQPDVVFLDLMMPDFDGFYAVEELKKSHPNAKIVIATADLRKETKERLDKLDVISILYKPYDSEQIRQILVEDLKIKLG